jgi:aminoglycoside phosphotransferase family enzyme/predicted kinase
MPDADQDEVLAFLEAGALGGPVERIDTHAAIVLLTGDRAFKLKRPVRYSFLDFTTLAQRERTLRHELELNRRTAPELYRRVLPVTRGPGGLALDGDGEPVEWLLEMLRFPAEAQLDRVAAAQGLSDQLVDRLAEVVAASHASATPRLDKGGLAALREVADGNLEDLRAAVPAVFTAAAVRDLGTRTEAQLARHGPLLERRRAAGLVRHCHGDLHLANIVLLGDRPVLFDCVEFDDDLACIDVLYDLAFLLMDLIEKGHRAAAARLLNGWLERTRDHAALARLPLFLSLRAAIRAKVLGLAAVGGADAEPAEARRYLTLAAAFLSPPAPILLAIGGGSGTGKTTLARALAPGLQGPAPGAVILRSDVIRKELFGRPATERLPAKAYTSGISTRVFATIAERAAACLAAGHSVIADAVYGQPEQRAGIEAVAAAVGVPFRSVWLDAPLAARLDRVTRRTGDASDADAVVVHRQAESIDNGAVHWRRIVADRSAAEIAAELLSGCCGATGRQT